MDPSKRIPPRAKVTFESATNVNPKEPQSKIPKRLPSRSLSLSRISDVRGHSSLEPSSQMIRSKTTLTTTPLMKNKSVNPQQLFPPPPFSDCHDRLLPSPTSSRKQSRQVSGSAVKTNAQRSKDVDTRPFDDKKWQQSQSQKIQQYLQRNEWKNADGYSLRPLSINTFIEICNLLFTKLDTKLVITKENYVEELPFILRSLGYPSSQNLKKSLMKAVNIPRNWPMAVGILSWIVELVEGFESFDYESHIPNKQKIMANALFDSYQILTKNPDGEVEIPINHTFDQLVKCENLTDDDFNNVKKQIEEIERKLENVVHEEHKLLETQNDYENKKRHISTMEQKVLEKENLKQKKISQIKQLKTDLNENEYILNNLFKEKESLLKTIKSQGVDKEEYLATLNNCEELEQDIASLNKLIENLRECTYVEEMKMKRKYERVVRLSEEFNKKCLSNITELNSFAVYNVTLTNPNTHHVLLDLKNKLMKTWEEQLQESEKLDLEATEIAELNKKMEQLKIIDSQEIPKLKHENELLREKIDKAKNMIQNYQIETERHIKQYKECESKIVEVENLQKKMISESEKLFKKMEEEYFAYGYSVVAHLEEIYGKLDASVKMMKEALGEK
ncbi:kinetochore protein ndc80-like [Chrysoperla carnea]|uniref:kinetochore protein ndc80-like n=1 Tax=Chrysoperla carnea TaxID=189513 RepID=UPI001D08F059|nr:kinetochore protein ndc80-like [Chrysoperla carnea]